MCVGVDPESKATFLWAEIDISEGTEVQIDATELFEMEMFLSGPEID